MQLARNIHRSIQTHKYTEISYLLFFVLAFWGPALGGIRLGMISLFPARIFALATWGLVCVGLAANFRQIKINKAVLKEKWQIVFLAAWLGWAALSLCWAIDLGQGLRDLFNLFMGLSLVGLAPFFLNDERKLTRAAKIWVTTFGIFLGVAVIENITLLHFPISRFAHGIQPHLSYRPTAVFVNENNFAVLISLSLPFLLARWRYFTARKARIASGLGIFSGIYMLFVTGSRINYMVLILTVFLYSLFLTSRGKRLKVLTLLILAVVGIWIFFGITQPAVQGYMAGQLKYLLDAYMDLLNPIDGDIWASSNSVAVRVNMVRNGVVFLVKTWGMGVGVGNFEAWIETRAVYDTLEFLNPHNWWMELAAEYGLLVTLGYLAFFASLLLGAWKSWKQAVGQQKWIPEALCLALAIFPLAAISPNSLLDYLPHWILLALALAWQQHASKAGE